MDLSDYLSAIEHQESDHTVDESFNANIKNILSNQKNNYSCTIGKISFFEDRGIKDHGLLEVIDSLDNDVIVAGGFFERVVNGERPTDIDIFFTSEESFINALYNLEDSINISGSLSNYEVNTDLHKLLNNPSDVKFVELVDKNGEKPKIQLIKTMWYDGPEHVIDTFDFTATQFAIYKGVIHTTPTALLDVARKRLVVNRITFPVSSMRRMVRYTQKGYYMCSGSLQVMSRHIQQTLNNHSNIVEDVYYID